MPGSSSWMPYVPQGVKGFDDDGVQSDTNEQKHMFCGSKILRETVLVVMRVLGVTNGPLICL